MTEIIFLASHLLIYLAACLFVFIFCNCFRQCNVIVCDVHIIIHDFTDFSKLSLNLEFIEFGAMLELS